uniref:Presenilin n=1 Tax=Meloidogyne javanica TaxID=6303 RepID=A0A915MPM2_MELJA
MVFIVNNNEGENNEEENSISTTSEERTASDVLDAYGQTVLGYGDFIAYGMFVGKTAADMGGCLNLTVLFTIIGILFGLLYTLKKSEASGNGEEPSYLPALPIPLSIGAIIYL